MNVGPVPGGPATDRPAGLGHYATVPPDVHCGPLYPQPLCDFSDAYRVAISHEKTVAKVLTVDQGCSDNQYMTETRYMAEATVNGRTTKIENCRSEAEARDSFAAFTAAGYTVTNLTVRSYPAARTHRLP